MSKHTELFTSWNHIIDLTVIVFLINSRRLNDVIVWAWRFRLWIYFPNFSKGTCWPIKVKLKSVENMARPGPGNWVECIKSRPTYSGDTRAQLCSCNSSRAWGCVSETTRWNAGHARGDQFWPSAPQFPAQNFKGNHKKQPLSRKMSKRKL